MKAPGRVLGVVLAFSFSARFLIEFVKEEQAHFEEAMLLNMGQLLSIPFILAGLVLVYRKAASEGNQQDDGPNSPTE
jgi:prolipoprotein diacylglyceryltransferase